MVRTLARLAMSILLLVFSSSCIPLTSPLTTSARNRAVAARNTTQGAAQVTGPQKQSLAYVAAGRLYILPLAGGDSREVPTPWPVNQLLWSPSGDRLAVSSQTYGKPYQLAVVDPQMPASSVVLTDSCPASGGCHWLTSWSPDGRYLAVGYRQDFSPV